VITSWGGTFMATVCKLTLRMRSMPNGRTVISPGPFGRARTRPSRKTTARSCSGTIRTVSTIKTIRTAVPATASGHCGGRLLIAPPGFASAYPPVRYFLGNAQSSPNDTDPPI
jgi:hypothetical protein